MTTTDATTAIRRPQEGARVWLSRFLALDAAVTGANGLAYVVASGPLGELLGVGSALLFELGIFLVLFAGAVAFLATRPAPSVKAVTAVIDANVVWAVLSIVTVLLWLDAPTTAGMLWIPMQALTVGGFAVLQFAALRRYRG
ncbi:hypothetical protein [Streptomyces fragilis]|uniref:Integral membrane protein n=1 Tax=Streptomyces fragilis TaxID=67301 RepID=A0ABV2YJF2_9ACTN|nr:hypothetical protein [Streptomyces fragilis]